MSLKRVMFVGRYSAETCGPWSDFALISLNDPNAKDGDAMIPKGWHDVLRLSFHDITPDTLDPENNYTLADDSQAKQIVDFVRKASPDVEGIIVHCRAGISRSAAVAKWICGQYQIPFNPSYDLYNKFLYRMLILASEGGSFDQENERHLAKLRAIVNKEDPQ